VQLFGAHDEHGTGRETHGGLGDRAEDQARDPAPAVRADDHDIGFEIGRELRDFFTWHIHALMRDDRL
jgi:hypothetical protein